MPNLIDATVRALVHARKTGQTVNATDLPLPQTQVVTPAGADNAAAYLVQARVASELGSYTANGPRTWKSGGPSRTAELTHAPLPDAGVWTSPADAAAWPFHLRAIEAEVALRLGQDVNADRAAGLDLAGSAGLIDAMCVSIEIVDSRWTQALQAPAWARLADLNCHGALVLGSWVPFVARDWSTQVCRVGIGHQPVVEHVGTHSLQDPCFVLPAWLRHATLGGRTVPAGTVVTTGTWCGLLHAAAGDRVTVEFPGIGRAEVQL